MEGTSEDLQLWKHKLDEIVTLSSQLQPGDHKVAKKFWYAALKQIQTLWNKSSPVQISERGVDGQLPGDESSTENTTCHLFTDWKRNIQQPKIELPVINRKMNKEVKHNHRRMSNEEHSVKNEVKQEPINTQEWESQDRTKNNDPNEVQSVHLMISADPILVPNMNKFRRVYKNEVTGKTETAYQCEKCPKQCRTALALYKHRSSHTKSLECSICHQRLSNRHALNVHKRTHTGERPYECTKCSSRFTTRGNLARHLASHDGEKPWQCSVCAKRYTEKKSLKVHLRTHTGEKPYACTQCPKRFSQSGILQAHMLIHTDQFAHLCDICGRSFRQRSQLITHHLRHEGVRPFACPECERRFTTKGDMDRHLRIHTGERPFHCDVCGSSFARPQTLQEHKNRHFNFKPYVCKICSKKMKHHIFVIHTADTEETELITIAEPSNSHCENGQSPGSAVSCEGCGTLMSSVSVLRKHAVHCRVQQEGLAEWLVQRRGTNANNSIENTVGDENEDDGEETGGELKCVEEVDGTNLSHAVTISEDGSITSVPLSQLAPIHLQIESK
nr:gastrula zinc finger protein XlCGF57.1-like [Cherax quadricarinatus]